jgi:hypothetical protein
MTNGTRRAPPSFPAGATRDIYCVEHSDGTGEAGGTFYLRPIRRCIVRVCDPLTPRFLLCVRYNRLVYPLHSVDEWPALMREIRAKQLDGGLPYLNWEPFRPRKDERRPFIKAWEMALGAYW